MIKTKLKEELKNFKSRFEKLPEEIIADKIYGTKWNRKFLKKIGVEENFR